MHIEFLETQTVDPKTLADYKKTSFEFDARSVHPINQLEIHKQTCEMVSSTLTNPSINLFKMQVSLSNSQSQLNMERISLQSKDTKIKSLEDLIVKIGYDPSDLKEYEEIIKKKRWI